MYVALDDLFPCSPILLDGGLGTTLEDVIGSTIVTNSPLWSAQPIAFAPDEIISAHKMFLEAGANIISTSTYQCSLQTFERAGFIGQDARLLMLKSVHLAREAVRQFREEQSLTGDAIQEIRIALSLGPFGATLKPTEEFRGFYPPPYGPKESVNLERRNAFSENSADENVAIDALAQFHFDRLSIFAMDEATWEEIDCLAFETVPLKREVTAIRKAVTWLKERVLTAMAKPLKPWWISCVFPNGKFPDGSLMGGPGCQLKAILHAAFQSSSLKALEAPSAFGINCTAIEHISGLCQDLLQYFETTESDKPRPWTVIYANGGSGSYNESTGLWTEHKGEGDKTEWAKEASDVLCRVTDDRRSRHLGGIIIGGCCKTTPADISRLRRQICST